MGWIHRVAPIAACIALAAHAQSPGSMLAAGARTQPSGWMLVDIGTLGGPGSYGAALSDNGIVVGCSDVNPSGVHAFVYAHGVMRDLGTGDSNSTGNACALAVNNAGTVAGRSTTGELVVWNGDAVTKLGIHGNAAAMNDAGSIVGSYKDTGVERAFVYRDGRLTDVGLLAGAGVVSFATSVNASDEVVGSANGRAFLYASGTLRDLGTLGGNSSVAKGINDLGQIVGFSSNANGQPNPFIYEGSMRALPAGSYSEALGINNRVQVIGSGEGRYGFLIENGNVVALDTLPSVQAKGWHHLEPAAINERGWIVGTAQNAAGDSRAFLLVPRTP
jgi:probable HAF family extracellular repeat protein